MFFSNFRKSPSLKKALKFSQKSVLGAITISSIAFSCMYSYIHFNAPELNQEPRKIVKACVRTLRLGLLGLRMQTLYSVSKIPSPLTYKYGSDSLEEKHQKAALMMLETFRINAGMFVKFGQLMASMGVLFPDAYVTAMKSMFQEAPSSK
jgi:hypothetical protein